MVPQYPLLLIPTLVFVLLIIRRKLVARNISYPPGPQPLPIVGNLFDIPLKNERAAYQELAKHYGDLVHLSALGRHVLFINSFETACELLEKRSLNYSDRPQSTMSNELIGWEFSFAHMLSDDKWKRIRRMFHRGFQQSEIPKYQSMQRREAHRFLRDALSSPIHVGSSLHQNISGLIMTVTYGIEHPQRLAEIIWYAEKAIEGVSMSTSPGAFMVDLIPILKYVPEWVPGASFQKKAREWRSATMAMRDVPFKCAVDEMKDGNFKPSFVSNLLSESIDDEDRSLIRDSAAVVFSAASEAIISVLSTFILAMVTHSDVQEKAHAELDRVVGSERLPEFKDRPSLPYISAILKEVLRWNPPAPLALPHMTRQDDEYKNYFIPAGTIVIGNTWGILNDPVVFPDPRRFNPDRFISEKRGNQSQDSEHLSPTDPLSAMFGFGRRFCPGRFLADAQLWIHMASFLNVFKIVPKLDENGVPIPVVPAFTKDGFVCQPLPFKYDIQLRRESDRILIEETNFTTQP